MKFFLTIFFLSFCHTSFSQFQTEHLSDLIDELIKNGDLFRAVTTLKEAEYRYIPSAKGFSFNLKLIRLSVEHNEFELADSMNDKLAEKYKQYPRNDYLIRKAEILYFAGNAAESQMITSEIVNKDNPSMVSYLSDYKLRGDTVLTLDDRISYHAHMKKKKSKPLAIAFSVIPGVGQMYVEKFASGLSSLLLNAFAVGISVLAFQNGETALGISSGIIGASFYASNFYATAVLVDRHNQSVENDFQKHLHRKYRATFRVFGDGY